MPRSLVLPLRTAARMFAGRTATPVLPPTTCVYISPAAMLGCHSCCRTAVLPWCVTSKFHAVDVAL